MNWKKSILIIKIISLMFFLLGLALAGGTKAATNDSNENGIITVADGQDIEIADIIAGIKNSESLLHDYELSYKTTTIWHYNQIYSQSDISSPWAVRKPLRIEPKTEEEKQKAMISDYTWRAKGAKFAYTRDFEDNINDFSFSEQHAFNGQRHLSLNKRPAAVTGVVLPPDDFYKGLSLDVVSPADFFEQLSYQSIVDWLNEEVVTVSPDMETLLGRRCYVVECRHEWKTPRPDESWLLGKFWLSPDLGFRPLKIEYHSPHGLFSSHEVTVVKEVADGLWLPMKGIKKEYGPYPAGSESLTVHKTTEFEVDPKTVKVNSGIDDEQFTFTFPIGTVVDDFIARRVYVVGEARTEKQKGQEKIDHPSEDNVLLDKHSNACLKSATAALEGLLNLPAPPLVIERWYNGRFWQLDLKGKVVLLDFWGVWCGPCKHEIPFLTSLSERFSRKGLIVIGVHTQYKKQHIAEFISRESVPYLVGVDYQDKTAETYHVRGYPTKFVIDQRGIIKAIEPGKKELEELIISLLKIDVQVEAEK